jgi:hypothetical protein
MSRAKVRYDRERDCGWLGPKAVPHDRPLSDIPLFTDTLDVTRSCELEIAWLSVPAAD